jgi:hypothetical protein
MRTLYNLLSTFALIYVVFWFIRFQFNPYEFCIDHPREELKENYYLCEPFDFELKKGLIDNKSTLLWRPPIKKEDQMEGEPRTSPDPQ